MKMNPTHIQFGAKIPLLKRNPIFEIKKGDRITGDALMSEKNLRGPNDEMIYFPKDAEKAKKDLAGEGHVSRVYPDTPADELADPDIPATSGVTVRINRPGYIAGDATVLLGPAGDHAHATR